MWEDKTLEKSYLKPADEPLSPEAKIAVLEHLQNKKKKLWEELDEVLAKIAKIQAE